MIMMVGRVEINMHCAKRFGHVDIVQWRSGENTIWCWSCFHDTTGFFVFDMVVGWTSLGTRYLTNCRIGIYSIEHSQHFVHNYQCLSLVAVSCNIKCVLVATLSPTIGREGRAPL